MFKVRWNLVWSFWATIFIPLLYLINIKLAFESGNLQFFGYLNLLGTFVSIFGLIFWIISYINLGRSFGVLPQKQKKVKLGLYKYFNHPMYIGISAVMIGLSIANNSFVGLVFYCLVILPVLTVRSNLEEKKLT
jgi:protein-S-isoprenylcysteine O-methyltransferase Ste14